MMNDAVTIPSTERVSSEERIEWRRHVDDWNSRYNERGAKNTWSYIVGRLLDELDAVDARVAEAWEEAKGAALDAINNEALADVTGEETDIAYNRAIRDAFNAVAELEPLPRTANGGDRGDD